MLVMLRNSSPVLNSHCIFPSFTRAVKRYQIRLKHIRFYCAPAEPGRDVEHKCFEDMVWQRRAEARRSFIVQVFSRQSCWDLLEYCKQIAPVKFMHHYCLNPNDHFVIAELANNEIDEFLRSCRHTDEAENLNVKSPFLWFKAQQQKKKRKTTQKEEAFPSYSVPEEEEMTEMLSGVESITEQMKMVFEGNKLSEIGTRLRFLTARQVELALSGLFPRCSVLPFGSSVNGFGKAGSDLDLGLRYSPSETTDDSSRLVFQNKVGGQRAHTQRQMETLADVLHIYLPGCSNVRRILRARVPIVKYCQDYTGLECDLSMTDLTGVYMSELLWLYGETDSRVRPLVFTVRQWARSVGLTSQVPGKYITNFTLTALIIFYLQTRGILPSYLTLVSLARPEDARSAGEVNCTFLRDVTLVPPSKDNTDPGTLLSDFFEFYSGFDYERYGICLRVGGSIVKPDHSPLYLVNPLEPSFNVSRNVSLEELTRLKVECRNASWLVQSTSSVLNLFRPSHPLPSLKQPAKIGRRMLTLEKLFKSHKAS